MLTEQHEEIDLSLNDQTAIEETEEKKDEAPVVEPEKKPEASKPVEDVSLESITTKTAVKKDPEMVPLPKYMESRNRVKELEKELEEAREGGVKLTNTDLDSLAAEYNTDPNFVKKLAATMKAEAINEIRATVDPLLAERQQAENDRSFNEAFDKVIKAAYGDQIDREAFREIALNPSFAYLKSFDGIVKKFWSHIKPVTAESEEEIKTETIESGSKGAVKSETINFAKMTDKQHEDVLGNPKLKAEYYKWKDSQGV